MKKFAIKRRVWLFDKLDRWLTRHGWHVSRTDDGGARIFDTQEEAREIADKYEHTRVIVVKV